MRPNRSIPDVSVIPELAYAELGLAVRWLCDAFGFQERLRVADHRVQLVVGGGAVVAMDSSRDTGAAFSETMDDVDPATWGGVLNPPR
jgi:hypothetical protein